MSAESTLQIKPRESNTTSPSCCRGFVARTPLTQRFESPLRRQLQQASENHRIEGSSQPAMPYVIVIHGLEQRAFRARAIQPDAATVTDDRFPVIAIEFKARVRVLGVGQVSSEALDCDAECDISAVVHQMVATLVGFIQIADVVEANVPCGVQVGHLRTLPDNLHWRWDDRLDHDLACARLATHAFEAPSATRIWRPMRSHPARSCAKAKKAVTPIMVIYQRNRVGTAGGSSTIAAGRNRSGRTVWPTRTM